MHVLDVATANDLTENIERAHDAVVTWRPDNRSFFYMKFPKATADTPANETEYNARTYLHVLGRDVDGESDAVVFGRGVAKLDVPEGQATYVVGAPQSPWVVAVANHNIDDNPSTLYVAPLARTTGAATPWKKVADVDDGISQIAVRGDTLYFLSRKDASRFRILATLARAARRPASARDRAGRRRHRDRLRARTGRPLLPRRATACSRRWCGSASTGRTPMRSRCRSRATCSGRRPMPSSRVRCSTCRAGRDRRPSSRTTRRPTGPPTPA